MSQFWARLTAAIVVATAAATVSAQPVEREGVKFEPTVTVGGAPLQLNGTGLRTRAVFKVYVAGLYVPAKATAAGALLAQKGPRRLQIAMLRNVDADSFAGPLNEGLKNNHTEAQLTAMKAQIDAFNAAFKTVGEAKKGDVITIDFVPDSGTRLAVNGQAKGAAIPGEDFYAALLRIWLGDKPADGDLKKGLLGG